MNRTRLFWLLPTLLLVACQPESVSWQPNYEVPLAKGKITLAEMVTENANLQPDANGLMRIVFRDTVASINPTALIVIPDTGAQFSFQLDSLKLPANQIVQRISLGQLATQLANSSDPNSQATGQFILDNHGNTLPFFPPTPGISTDPTDIDVSQFFQSADIIEGTLKLTISNYLPVDLNNVSLNIKNKASGISLVNDTYANIPSGGGSVKRNYDLAGKHVESALSGQLTNLDVAGGLLVPIDTTDYIELKLELVGIKASQATAAFPSQTLVDTIQTTNYNFDGDFSDVQITKIVIESGQINASASSTLPETIDFQYTLLSSDKNGSPAYVSLQVDPATPGAPSYKQKTIPLDGYTFDLTQDVRSPFNTLREQIRAVTVESGKIVTLTQQDHVDVIFRLENIVPRFVEGYIGKTTFVFSGEEALDVLNSVDVSKLYLANPSAAITFTNSVGVDARITVRSLKAMNSATGQSASLTGTPLLAGPVIVNGPNLPDTNQVVETHLAFTAQNSNIIPFINLQPDKVSYSFEVEANYNGQPFRFDNFATSQSEVMAYLDVEVPIEGQAEGLNLQDSLEADFSSFRQKNVDGAALRLVLKNGFPLAAKVNVWVSDATGSKVMTFLTDEVISAALPATSGRVETPAISTLKLSLTEEQMETLAATGKKVVIRYTLDTRPAGKNVKLYSDYGIEAQLVGKLSLHN